MPNILIICRIFFLGRMVRIITYIFNPWDLRRRVKNAFLWPEIAQIDFGDFWPFRAIKCIFHKPTQTLWAVAYRGHNTCHKKHSKSSTKNSEKMNLRISQKILKKNRKIFFGQKSFMRSKFFRFVFVILIAPSFDPQNVFP